MKRYSYKRLPEQPPTVRLVTLAPSPVRDSPLVCIVSYTQLPSSTEYTALSYFWGDPAPTHSLVILPSPSSSQHEGQTLAITSNLDAALRHIRDRKLARSLWIDAVSINQEDYVEKSQQIPLMWRVYSDADEVLAWVGEGGGWRDCH